MSQISREVCEQYLDALVTVELAVKFASLDGRKINATISEKVRQILPKLTDHKVRAIFTGLTRQMFPDGALKMLRRQLDSLVGDLV